MNNHCEHFVEEIIEVVTEFSNNVLARGLDRWSEHGTPLLANGINLETWEPVEWIYRSEFGRGGSDGDWIIHNLSNQQNLFRVFVGLKNLTGNGRFHDAAKASIQYHFDHLASECGLLRWGGHQIINLRTLEPAHYKAFAPGFGQPVHELKNHLPFYELMWEVDSEATARFLRAFWNSHVTNWNHLTMNRHGAYGLPMGDLWDNEFTDPGPFSEAGMSFLNAGTDLIYAGTLLYLLNQEEGALLWTKRMANLYYRSRHPNTGLGAYQYTMLTRTEPLPPDGPVPNIGIYGDRANAQFGHHFPETAREGWALFHGKIYTVPALTQMELAERLGPKGAELLDRTIEGLKAYASYGYEPESNHFRPMWADGTDLTGYTIPRTGYYGPKGQVLRPYPANAMTLFSFARAYRMSGNGEFRSVIRPMLKGMGLADVKDGTIKLHAVTEADDPIMLFALLELLRATGDQGFLHLSEAIGRNIVRNRYRRGFFLRDAYQINADFNTLEPLSLLTLAAVITDERDAVPVYSGGQGSIHGWYRELGRTYDHRTIWRQRRKIETSRSGDRSPSDPG